MARRKPRGKGPRPNPRAKQDARPSPRSKQPGRGKDPQKNRPSEPGVVQVNGYSDRWLGQGFPWVYPTEVVSGQLQPAGQSVEVRGPQGAVRGRGLTDIGWIAVRIMRHDGGPLDQAWMDGVLEAAARRRERLIPADTTARRLLHGESDGLPGVRVDWWDGWAVVALDSPALEPIVPLLVQSLQDRYDVRGVFRCYRPDPRDTRDVHDEAGWVVGDRPDDEVVVVERGMAMRVRPWEGPDVGSYMDMREVRAWLEPHWSGRSLLNTFAYTGAFSVSAARHGATRTVSVDLSRGVLDRAQANFAANGIALDEHAFVAEDTFRALDRLRRKGERFDVVLLDPPSFSHGPAGDWSARKDMPRLVAAAARVVAPGGWLVAASNQGQVSPKAFRGSVAEGLRKARRHGAEVAWFGAAPDFPAAVTFPEAHYLKVGVWTLD
jgi:23S rRNA (cytosine1962-C5)-methyltransferase